MRVTKEAMSVMVSCAGFSMQIFNGYLQATEIFSAGQCDGRRIWPKYQTGDVDLGRRV